MRTFRVAFYKNLTSSEGHNFKCLQRHFDVDAESAVAALRMAERRCHHQPDCDSVEIIYPPPHGQHFEDQPEPTNEALDGHEL
jgi:hypothetical protein